jgi:CheY-like chemotaxis protein
MSKRILVVDDDLTTCLLAKRMVTELGFVCELASDGAEAVRALSESHFDVVLMDIYMQILSGLHATIAIRSLHPDSAGPAIYGLISGDEAAMRRQCTEADMDGVVMKPIDRTALRGILDRFIASTACTELRGEVVKASCPSDPVYSPACQDDAPSYPHKTLCPEQLPEVQPNPAFRPASGLITCSESTPSSTQSPRHSLHLQRTHGVQPQSCMFRPPAPAFCWCGARVRRPSGSRASCWARRSRRRSHCARW